MPQKAKKGSMNEPSPLPLHVALTGIALAILSLASGRPLSSSELGPVGVAKVDITPETPVRMYGYAARKTESEGVSGRLHAAALAIGGDEGRGPAVLLTVDCGAVPAEIRDEVLRRVRRKTPLEPERFMLTNAHIHSGPIVKAGGYLSDGERRHVEEYALLLADRLEEVVGRALLSRRPGHLAWGRGTVRFAANRRVLKDGKWAGFGAVPDAPVDHELPVLRVTDAEGKILAVAISYACHNTTLRGDQKRIHADWAGCAQELVEADFPGAVAMVALGCGADADPFPHGTIELCLQHGRAVAEEVKRVLAAPLRPLPTEVAARSVALEIRGEAASVEAETVPAGGDTAVPPPVTKSYPLTTWCFGEDLAMVFLSHEVVVDYALRLKRELDRDRLWINAYANEVSHYIVSKRLIAEGGYEVENSLSARVSARRPERVEPAMEDRIIEAVRSLLPAFARGTGSSDGETLPNGIRLPATWPPPNREPTREPMPIPYLADPPPVIPIDVGRQLFVDDFLIEETTLERTSHRTVYHPENPVLRPDRPWESDTTSGGHPAPTAMVFSDGVWYDPADALFKMWYMGGYVKSTCYAVSKDGIHWDKPSLDVVPGTNVVLPLRRDSATVWLDLAEGDPARRFKLFVYPLEGRSGILSIFFSADGIHWGERAAESGRLGDRSTVFLNPFRDVWVYGIRAGGPIGRSRRYREHTDPIAGAAWKEQEPVFWVGADCLDPPRPGLGTSSELYNLDAVAYESLILGLFSIWRGQPSDRAKPNEVCVGFSRDGFHWHRPTREAFLPVSERYGDWNWGNVQSAGGCCLVVGDRLYFYASGRKGIQGSPASGECATGLATLRRDGFASMDAGEEAGSLTTRRLRFGGRRLFVNLDAPEGEFRAAILDEEGEPLRGYSMEECVPVRADSTRAAVRWAQAEDLASVSGRSVRFRFHLRKGRLYAFWVSPSESGASHGYVAAGGPGFTGPTDTGPADAGP
jgi:hypothetical protein